jgi:cell division GTPase FtsZ
MTQSVLCSRLVLGLGSGAARLIQGLNPVPPECFEQPGFLVETLDTYTTGLDGWDFDRETLKALLDTVEKVLLVVCAGGKAGSAMTLFSAEYATLKKISVDVLMSAPFSWEGPRRKAVQCALTEGLRAAGAKVDVVEADQFFADDMESALEAFAVLDAAMANEVNRWIVQDK